MIMFIVIFFIILFNGVYIGSMVEVLNMLGVLSEDIIMVYYLVLVGIVVVYFIVLKICIIVILKILLFIDLLL